MPFSLMAQQDAAINIQNIFETYQINNHQKTNTEADTRINFYKKHISKQISAQCEFECTCSEFMIKALHHVGLVRGLLLGIDRLSRCGASDKTYTYLPALKSSAKTDLIDDISFYE